MLGLVLAANAQERCCLGRVEAQSSAQGSQATTDGTYLGLHIMRGLGDRFLSLPRSGGLSVRDPRSVDIDRFSQSRLALAAEIHARLEAARLAGLQRGQGARLSGQRELETVHLLA